MFPPPSSPRAGTPQPHKESELAAAITYKDTHHPSFPLSQQLQIQMFHHFIPRCVIRRSDQNKPLKIDIMLISSGLSRSESS